MTIPEELKEKVFLAIEGKMPLRDFESWLYANEALSRQMSESVVLEAYAFNYNQDHALTQFSSALLHYFDRDEFWLWKITLNLKEIIDGKDSMERILKEFFRLGYKEFPFLLHLGSYSYDMEYGWYPSGRNATVKKLKADASELLLEIMVESKDPQFKISSFVRKSQDVETVEIQESVSTGQKKWWKFWQ